MRLSLVCVLPPKTRLLPLRLLSEETVICPNAEGRRGSDGVTEKWRCILEELKGSQTF